MLRQLSRYSSLRNIALALVEHVALVGCTLLACEVRFLENPRGGWAWCGEYPILKGIGIALVFQLCNYFLGVYDHHEGGADRIRRRSAALICGIMLVFGAQYAPALAVPPGVFWISMTLVLAFYAIWVAGLSFYVRLVKRSNVLVIGTSRLAQQVVRELIKRPEMPLKVCGFLSDDPKLLGVRLVNPGVIGLTADLPKIVKEKDVWGVVVAVPDRRGVLPIAELLELKCRGVKVEDATSVYERVTGKIAIENLRPSWLIFNEGFELSNRTLLRKDLFSLVFSAILLLLSSPIILLVALAIRLESKGPVIFRQERVGLNGRTFQLLKFRSMRVDAEEQTGPVWASERDPRVTRVGRVLRRTRLDELPQLLNVLRGDMHFVGPRPERPVFVKDLQEKIPYYGLRHIVKPGITGWAQINYGYARNEEDTIEKLQYDLYYIKNMSTLLDVLIILETAKAVIKSKGV